MVQNFVVFTDSSAAVKKKNHEILQPRCGLDQALARNLEPGKFLLKAWIATPQKFAPAKISRYTVFRMKP